MQNHNRPDKSTAVKARAPLSLPLRVFIVGGVVTIGIGIFLLSLRSSRREMLPFERGPFADVTWKAEGTPLRIECTVTDPRGLPLEGVQLDFRNNSGGNGGVTDKEGRAILKVSEPDLEQIKVNGRAVMDRPNAYRLGYPDVSQGLRVEIVMKEHPASGKDNHQTN